jgi:hypothetical protein
MHQHDRRADLVEQRGERRDRIGAGARQRACEIYWSSASTGNCVPGCGVGCDGPMRKNTQASSRVAIRNCGSAAVFPSALARLTGVGSKPERARPA